MFGFDVGTGRTCFNDPISTSDYGQGWYDNVIAVHPTNKDEVWIGGKIFFKENSQYIKGIDVWRSIDGGSTFKQASNWAADETQTDYLHADIHVISFSPSFATDSTIYIGTTIR